MSYSRYEVEERIPTSLPMASKGMVARVEGGRESSVLTRFTGR